MFGVAKVEGISAKTMAVRITVFKWFMIALTVFVLMVGVLYIHCFHSKECSQIIFGLSYVNGILHTGPARPVHKYPIEPSTTSLYSPELSTNFVSLDKPKVTSAKMSLLHTRWKLDMTSQIMQEEDLKKPEENIPGSNINGLPEQSVPSKNNPFSQVGRNKCRDSMCSEYLNEVDSKNYKFCTSISRGNRLESDIIGPCQFMDGHKRASVGLMSIPGSGNTWFRAILEAATGICTGAGYCDTDIRGHGFNGERITSGAVLVVKTHHTKAIWTDRNKPVLETMEDHRKYPHDFTPVFGAQIIILRNPFDAMVAEWNRNIGAMQKKTPHIYSASQDRFHDSPNWNKFVRYAINFWRYTVNYIVSSKKRNHPIHVTRFEDMKKDLSRETAKILKFLNISLPNDELERRLSKDLGAFKRKHHDNFQPFTPSQKMLVNEGILNALTYLQKNINSTYSIEEYVDKTNSES